MSDSRTYRANGTLAGRGYALAKPQQRPERLLLQVLGGPVARGLGARLGSRISLDAFTPAGLPVLA